MSKQESTGFCTLCQKQVLIKRDGPNHVLHLILTICTCGFWAVIWILMAISAACGKWRCSQCGCPVKN